MPPQFLSEPHHFEGVLHKYADWVFDLDGVIWTGPGGDTREFKAPADSTRSF
jgi:hypothetical protein